MNTSRAVVFTVMAWSCAPASPGCEPLDEGRALHADVREASGVAASRTHRGVLWTHNDSDGDASVFAIDEDGTPLGSVVLNGAHNRDWEDIAVAKCPAGGPEGDCIFVADIGDNRATREGVGIWLLAEPDPARTRAADAVFIRLLYPDGARDAEAIAILDDGSLLLVTKGREQPVSAYRSPPLEWPAGEPGPITLRLAQRLSDTPVELPRQVTGAAYDRRGTVVIRAYAELQFYRLAGDSLAPVLGRPVALDDLSEPQGEGVTFGRRGRVHLVSEAGPQAIAPRLTTLRCRLP